MADKEKKGGSLFGKNFGGGGLSRPVEKPKDFKGTFKKLLEYLKPYKFKIILVFILGFFSNMFWIAGPKIMGTGTTEIYEGTLVRTDGINFEYLAKIIFILFALYLANFVSNYIMQYIMVDVAQNIVYGLRKKIIEKLTRLPLGYFDRKSKGDILSRLTNDVDNISNTLQQSLTQFITAVITIIGVVGIMLWINPMMSAIAFATLPITAYFTKLVAKRSQKYFKLQQNTLGSLNAHVEEMFTGHKIIKAFNYEEKAIEEFEETNEELYEVAWKAQFVSSLMMPIMIFISNIGYVLVILVGAFLMLNGRLKIGDLQAFIQYIREFSHPIMQIANIANIIQSTIASAERVFEVLEEDEEGDSESDFIIKDIEQGISFENLRFSYDKNKELIRNLNLDVEKGTTVAIVGPTGAGKTTMVNLLMRFYDINSGSIKIDGVDIRQMKRRNLREVFGMVLQDTWVFKGSIYENIAYGKDDATEEEICAAAKVAHADSFIRMLPNGYDTILNEETSNISQGQKQLITIARAFLKDPKVLILDEATSNVDTRTELLIQEATQKLMTGRTNFIIAHRLSTIRDADMILVMNDGDIIEKGSHEELISQDGFYKELYDSQFSLA